MDSPDESAEQLQIGVAVRDRLPTALPLLPRARLLSQPPRSVLELPPPSSQQPTIEQTQQQQLASNAQPPQRKGIMLDRLSELLERPQRIAYNILPEEDHARNDRSFGFHFFDREVERIQPKKLNNTGVMRGVSFESRFEGGNLLLAYEYSPDHYVLVLRPDYNTMCYCQWFYFQAANELTEPLSVTFSIVNMTKSSSLFSQGMKVIALEAGSTNWIRTGEDISYTTNQFPRGNGRYHTLSWRSTLQPGRPVRFAYSQPYLYSQLGQHLDLLQLNPLVRRSVLTRTILNNRVDMLTVSSGSLQNKKVIIIVSRTHPAQTVGSFVMQGVLDFLTSDKAEAKMLRDKFVFKLVPMINPDGVVLGSSRCSLRGVDLNRCWAKPNRKNDPEIFHLKKLVMGYARSERLVMFCDLHGHSKKKNIFAYGCHDRSQPHASRELPFILSKIHNGFSFEDCNFTIGSSKQGTARVSLWKKLRLPNIFTLESSFCSAEGSRVHLDQRGYRSMGEDLCKAINVYFSGKEDCRRDTPATEAYKLLVGMREQMLKELHRSKDLIKVGMEETSGSESEEQNQQLYLDIKNKLGASRSKANRLSPLKSEQSILKTQRSELLSYNYRKGTQTTYMTAVEEASSATQEVIHKQNRVNRKHLLNRKRLMRRPANATSFGAEKEARCLSENFMEVQAMSDHRPRLLQLKTSFREKPRLDPVIRSEAKIDKYVPQFINFNFEEKFRRTTLEAQYRSKLARQNRDQMLIADQSEKSFVNSREEAIIRAYSKKDPDKQQHRSFIQLNKKQPVSSRLEALLRRAYK